MTTHVLTAAAPSTSSTRRLRSVGAVLAGLVTIVALSSVTDAVLHATGVYPAVTAPPMSDALFALALAYRIVYGLLGCLLTARLAPARPRAHALVLGAVGTLLGTLGALAMWDAGPAWYSLANIAIPLPSAWLAATWCARTQRAR